MKKTLPRSQKHFFYKPLRLWTFFYFTWHSPVELPNVIITEIMKHDIKVTRSILQMLTFEVVTSKSLGLEIIHMWKCNVNFVRCWFIFVSEILRPKWIGGIIIQISMTSGCIHGRDIDHVTDTSKKKFESHDVGSYFSNSSTTKNPEMKKEQLSLTVGSRISNNPN